MHTRGRKTSHARSSAARTGVARGALCRINPVIHPQALAGELGQAWEAERWLEQCTPWLELSRREAILDDLQQKLREQQCAEDKTSLQPGPSAAQSPLKSWASPAVSKVRPLLLFLLRPS